jgi:divalent metal cation (Fe/Co/Zn/Cd) transporter
LFPFVGLKLNSWQLDPLGALLLSLFIIFDWSATCLSNIIRLSGSSASDRVMQKVLFVAWRFESLVNGFKNITAYHAGDGIWVEIDILMDPTEKLMQAHDVAETLQYCLEGLSEVDRAFVTVDCMITEFPRSLLLMERRYFFRPYWT